MPESDDEPLQHIATGGVVASDQRLHEPLSAFVGPTTSGEFNTIADRLVPKGCFRLEDILFEFDSSFVKPEIAKEMPLLADLRDKHKQGDLMPPLSIFGHADPSGKDDYNKQLSGRRATAIYAMLVRDVDLWEDLFTKPFGGDDWGKKQSIEIMLTALGRLPGPGEGNESGETKDAVKAFQADKGLKVDGVAGPKTRKALYRDYMDLLCGRRLELDKEEDFLGRHKDAGGKGDFQGCGEFNPIRMFSHEENERFKKAADKTERNAQNEPNRRVMILLFAPGRRVNPDFWPCPRVKEGVAACKKRFFADADKRRSFQEERREFDKTKDTFACRFYQIISDDSPCERFLTRFHIRLYDLEGHFIASAPFELTVGNRPAIKSKADVKGFAVAQDIEIPNKVTIRWGFPPAKNEPPELVFELGMFLKIDESDREEEARRKLNNLGYSPEEALEKNVAAFQREYGHLSSPPLGENGELDDPTMTLIRNVYAGCEDDLRHTQPTKKEGA
jgi:hypothetical protein